MKIFLQILFWIIILVVSLLYMIGCNHEDPGTEITYDTPVDNSIEVQVIFESNACTPTKYKILWDGERYTWKSPTLTYPLTFECRLDAIDSANEWYDAMQEIHDIAWEPVSNCY